MAQLEYAKDENYTIGADGHTVTRVKLITGDSVKDIVDSGMLPGYRSVHPEFPGLRLESGTFTPAGNTGGKIQGTWSGNYKGKTGGEGGSSASAADPWKLDAQEFRTQPFSVEKPLLWGYDIYTGEETKLVNTAGMPLEVTGEVYGTEYSFVYYTKNAPKVPNTPVINSTSVRIAGESFVAKEALLLPPPVNHIVDRDDAGRIIRDYYEIAVTIRILPFVGWMERVLNVGTMARFGEEPTPQPIYEYYPWESNNDASNIQTPPTFGSIQDVMAAKKNYANIKAGKMETPNEAWLQAYRELPYNEITEPVPLTEDGKIYVEAMKNPAEHPYLVKEFFKVKATSFAQYDMPTKREAI